jgi:topoisomerase IV subunit A
MTDHINTGDTETISASQYANESYLNYAMYTIMDRALPHIGDGLKPVHRRILHAMNELHLKPEGKYKKSARTVGDTLGKFHPHGDSACYEAMVLMAQPFTTRLPLVDGQGNWGDIDEPKSFAAMRYTEAKLTQYATSLLEEINQDTVEWAPNFDGTMQEPKTLPAQMPNILINGGTGIAVGLATDIPPHNPREVVDACIAVLTRARTSDDDILNLVKGPDFPTGGVITSSPAELRAAYLKGEGTVKVRAGYTVSGKEITINSLPYRVSINKVLEQIADLHKNKKLPMITDIKDHSDVKSPVALTLTYKGNHDPDAIMATLFANTVLASTDKIRLAAIGLDGRPQIKSLPAMVREWCEYRQQCFERKKRFRLRAVEKRLHIVEGLLVAYHHLDEVIRIIRESDQPSEALQSQLSLSEAQAKAILEIRLRQLARLEAKKLEDERDALQDERDALQRLLADDAKIKRAIISELKATMARFDKQADRKSVIDPNASVAVPISAQAAIPKEDVTVVLSKNHWVRSVKGHGIETDNLNFKSGDHFLSHIETRSDHPTLVMAKQGRFFAIDTHTLPNGKSTGEPLTKHMTLNVGDAVHAMLPHIPEQHVLLATRKGKGFRVPSDALTTRATKGKQILNVTEGDTPLPPVYIKDDHVELAILTQQGRLLIIPIADINISGKSQGVQLAGIKAGEFDAGIDGIDSVLPLTKGQAFCIFVGKRKLIIDDAKQDYYRCSRARRGVFFEERGKAPLRLAYQDKL